MQEPKKPKTRQQQLKKKLSTIKQTSELKNILKSSRQQNKKLVAEVRDLRDRVETIMNSRKTNVEELAVKGKDQAEAALVEEINRRRKELKGKYAKMKGLKEEINALNGGKIQEAQHNKANNMNILSNTQKQIKQLQKQLQDLQATTKKLQKTLESNKKQQNLNQPRIQQLQTDNKILKTKIASLRKLDYSQEQESILVQTTLIGNRRKVREIEARKSMFDLKEMALKDKMGMLSQDEIKGLKKEVTTLKKEVELVEGSLTTAEAEQKKKINELYVSNREILKKLKETEIQKCKLEQQNNLWRKKWSSICRSIQLHNKKIKKISTQAQTQQYNDPKPLRRDYAGILNKYRFDDRPILRDDKQAKIIGMMIYQIQRGIVTIQAYYSNGLKTELPIPQHFLQRCRVTKIECSEHDFFKLFKLKYNSIDNKITKVEIRSNKNIKYQYGEKKQWGDLVEGDTIYGFDIGVKEYPVCVFGSYNYQKGFWLLEGFGVEINQLKE